MTSPEWWLSVRARTSYEKTVLTFRKIYLCGLWWLLCVLGFNLVPCEISQF